MKQSLTKETFGTCIAKTTTAPKEEATKEIEKMF
jgi:hypothetical protein